jgi:hypothetical protein
LRAIAFCFVYFHLNYLFAFISSMGDILAADDVYIPETPPCEEKSMKRKRRKVLREFEDFIPESQVDSIHKTQSTPKSPQEQSQLDNKYSPRTDAILNMSLPFHPSPLSPSPLRFSDFGSQDSQTSQDRLKDFFCFECKAEFVSECKCSVPSSQNDMHIKAKDKIDGKEIVMKENSLSVCDSQDGFSLVT